jgi:hypothetical protein
MLVDRDVVVALRTRHVDPERSRRTPLRAVARLLLGLERERVLLLARDVVHVDQVLGRSPMIRPLNGSSSPSRYIASTTSAFPSR